MKKRIEKLIDLKSIITLLLTVTLVALVVCNMSIGDEAIKGLFISLSSSCFTYFFTKKKDDKTNSEENNADNT